MPKRDHRNPQAPNLHCALALRSRMTLMVIGTMMMGLVPALALDGSNTGAPKRMPLKNFGSGREALRAGLDDLKDGDTDSSIIALTYASAHGQPIALWKLGEMYANGDGVPRDALKAYLYFDRLVGDYDEDQSDPQYLSAFSSAFVALGIYCLNGIPDTNVRPDPRRAHELFQYAATTFGDPSALYNLAHLYLIGAGGVAKDKIAAIRWLALAAKKGHPPSQALLGHMLFLGDGVPEEQRARGLMWLELAKTGALGPKDQWIRELYQRDFHVASEGDRRAATAMLQAPAKGTPPPIAARSDVTSFLQAVDGAPTSSPAQ